MVEWGDASCKCLLRQSRPTFVSIKFGRMEFQVLDRNRLAGGEKDELSHGRRDSSNPLYALALKGLMLLSRDHRRLPPFSQTPHSLSKRRNRYGISPARQKLGLQFLLAKFLQYRTVPAPLLMSMRGQSL
jgi:hypothetical protein